MKDLRLFQSFDLIDEKYLIEAETYKARGRSKAKILRVVLPAAALIALISVMLVFILPMFSVNSDTPNTPLKPAENVESISEISGIDHAVDPFTPSADPTYASPSAPTDIPTLTRTSTEELIYKELEDHVEIKDYIGDSDVIVLPEKIGGLPVTKVEISEKAAETLSAIRFNDSVLEEVIVPSSKPIKLNVGKDVLHVDNSLLHNAGIYYIEVDDQNPNYTSFNGLLYSKDCKTLISCPAGYKVPVLDYNPGNNYISNNRVAYLAAQLQIVSEKAFLNCTALRGITLPQNVTSVGQRAFSGCTNLRSVTLPSSVMTLGNSLFDRCTSLSYLCYEGDLQTFIGFSADLPSTVSVFYALSDSVSKEEHDKVVSLFEQAEDARALLSRFSDIECGEELSADGARIVLSEELRSKEDLISLLERFFEESAVRNMIENDFDAYFTETDGRLYAYDKVFPALYDEGRDERLYAVTSDGEGGYYLTLRQTVPLLHVKAYIECRFHATENDGKLLFTDRFSLPAAAWYGLYIVESAIGD